MKFSTLISLLLSSQLILAQEDNVISVRKMNYDTTFYTETLNETTNGIKPVTRKINPFVSSNNKDAIWDNNALFMEDTFYVFTHWIPERLARMANENPIKFWRKINKLVKKNKMEVYSSPYRFNETTSEKNVRTFTMTYCKITNPNTGQVISNNRVAIDSTLTSTKVLSNRRFSYISAYDSIDLIYFNNNSKIRYWNSRITNTDGAIFCSLLSCLESHYRRTKPFGYFKSNNKVVEDSYEFYFNFENFLINKAVLIKNGNKKYYCTLEMKNDTLTLLDSPVPEFTAGRVDRRKNKIRFKYNSSGYTFYLKSPLFINHVWGSERFHYLYYNIPFANQ